MAELRWSHLDEATVPQWAELTRILAEVDETDEVYEAEDLAEELQEAGMTPERDTWAVRDGDRLVAFGQLRVASVPSDDGTVRCSLDGGVHPQWRRRGIGTALLDRMEARAVELNTERNPGLPAHFRTSGGIDGASVRDLLLSRGYAVVRWFRAMERDLPGDDLPAPGPGLTSPTLEDEDAVRVAHNAAFADHFGFTPATPERWRDVWRGRPARHEFSTIVRDDDGAVLVYVIASQWVKGELYIDLVGTIREARGRGLAAAALARTVWLARESGEYRVVQLEVDSASPTGADRLYERSGFRTVRVRAAMRKDA